MTTLSRFRLLSPVLSALFLCACASSTPGAHSWVNAERAEDCDHADEEQCVAVACEAGDCGLFDCEDNGVDIHKFTILIPEHIHRQIHSGTGRGGRWNQAWQEYRLAQGGRSVTPEELHRKAVELIFRFELTGPVVPYNAPVGPYQSAPTLRNP
ncbi:SitA6 family polymorphic toxin lipoprotein [Pyxidicoccus xibeiensis]|uniref:SitA6 family polymorphic toxin lipoprotein n=1 Tax=Pyxidicoccus xibeiensis TaxID=2906759 RepID=UPI0020A6E3B5|nr:TIGR02269 family lipoprotein [Pyxidicoccus xibeiensis]MCP3144322.1 TIGR02269 family lipoprotein [Pyxidicoccus xibeiensis]